MPIHSTTHDPTAGPGRAASCVTEYFSRLAESFGLPRSVGQIFSALFLATGPLAFADIVSHAAISKASASTGLRILQQLSAVQTVMIPGDRRTLFQAETSVRRLVTGLLAGTVLSQLDAGDRLLDTAESAVDPADDHLRQRLTSLRHWHQGARDLLPILNRLGLG